MPTHTGHDSKGCFAQWGSQAKYYYKCGDKAARQRAISRANRQGRAIRAAGYTGNIGGHIMFTTITMNIDKPMVRNDQMEGKDWLVVPMVMMTEGVHNGSSGPGFYSSEELGKIPVAWNHKPVVVYHPTQNGKSISACDPIVLTTRKIGVIMNTEFEDGKLKAEAWLDPDRVNAVDDRVTTAIENQTMLELSTGLFTDKVDESGTWNEEEFTWVAKNFVPDHLAVLPDMRGACSCADGAGFLRLNEDRKLERFQVDRDDLMALVENEMSHDSTRRLLSSTLRDQREEAWVEEVYDTFFIFEDGGKLFRQTYTDTNNQISIEGSPEEVVRVTEYRTITGTFVGNKDGDNKKGNTMDREKTVQALIANDKTHWTEDDTDGLMAMSDTTLTALAEQANHKDPEPEPEPTPEPTPETPAEEEPTDNMTTEKFIEGAPEPIREVLNNSMAVLQREKAKLIEAITTNEKNTFTPETLATKTMDELQSIAALAVTETKTTPPSPNYIGQGPVVTPTANAEEPLGLPVMNFDAN